MVRMRARSSSSRFAWAVVLLLLLAVRSLAPAGMMPAFDHGSLMIVACPDADTGLMTHHHHHPAGHAIAHHPCPYASASALGATGPHWTALLVAIFFAAALFLCRPFRFIERQREGERPPAIGPPIPA